MRTFHFCLQGEERKRKNAGGWRDSASAFLGESNSWTLKSTSNAAPPLLILIGSGEKGACPPRKAGSIPCTTLLSLGMSMEITKQLESSFMLSGCVASGLRREVFFQ